MLRATNLTSRTPPLIVDVIEAACQTFRETIQLLNLGDVGHEGADLWIETNRRIRLMWSFYKRFGSELYDMTTAPLSLKARMLEAEVVETLQCGRVTWTLGHNSSSISELRVTTSFYESLASAPTTFRPYLAVYQVPQENTMRERVVPLLVMCSGHHQDV